VSLEQRRRRGDVGPGAWQQAQESDGRSTSKMGYHQAGDFTRRWARVSLGFFSFYCRLAVGDGFMRVSKAAAGWDVGDMLLHTGVHRRSGFLYVQSMRSITRAPVVGPRHNWGCVWFVVSLSGRRGFSPWVTVTVMIGTLALKKESTHATEDHHRFGLRVTARRS